MNNNILKKIEEISRKQYEINNIMLKKHIGESTSNLEKTIKRISSLYTPDFFESIIAISRKSSFVNTKYFNSIMNNYKDSLKAMSNSLIVNYKYNYIEDFAKNIEKIYLLNFKKTFSINSLEYLTIVNKISNNTINNINIFINEKNENYKVESTKLRSIENAIPQYISYAYKEGSKDSVEGAYEKCILKKIEEKGDEIVQLVKAINDISPDFFRNTNSFIDLAYNIKRMVEKEEDLIIIINCFYKSVYEGSGASNNRIYKLSDENQDENLKKGLDFIKHIRQFFLHSKETTNNKYLSEIKDFIFRVIDKEYAIRPKDWLCIQVGIYEEVSKLLDNVLNHLIKQSKKNTIT